MTQLHALQTTCSSTHKRLLEKESPLPATVSTLVRLNSSRRCQGRAAQQLP
jgi:hypothetical protein